MTMSNRKYDPPKFIRTLQAVKKREKRIKKLHNRMWQHAKNAPQFSKTHEKNGKQFKRSARQISHHAYNIAISGALAAIANDQKNVCKYLNIPYGNNGATDDHGYTMEDADINESTVMTMKINKGAKTTLEQFLSSYIQSALASAVEMRTMQGRKRITASDINYAFNASVNSLSGAHAGSSTTVIVMPPPKKKAKTTPETADAPEKQPDDNND